MELIFGGLPDPPPGKTRSVRSRPVARKTTTDSLSQLLKGIVK